MNENYLVLTSIISIIIFCIGRIFFDAWILSKKYKRPFKKILNMIDKRMAKNYGRVKK